MKKLSLTIVILFSLMVLLPGCSVVPAGVSQLSSMVAAQTLDLLEDLPTVNNQPFSDEAQPKDAPAAQEEPAETPDQPVRQVDILANSAQSDSYAQNLETTLINLYQIANPSVVYIINGQGSGSGFVYSENGYIVTNNHVVDGSQQVEVVFSTGERMLGELIGSDADSDLAVVQVDQLPKGVQPLPLADFESIQVGEFVVAIGNPFGETGSMSMGIVSGVGRSLQSQRGEANMGSYSLPEVIQTDAPINPGNSGGPLLNLNGEVVGVNSAIATTSGSSSGVGFAIPSSAIQRIVPVLIDEGSYTYSYMGVAFDNEISLEDLSTYDLEQTQGVYLLQVNPGGPADKAGLKAADPQTGRGGDLIIAIDGQPVNSFGALNSYLVFHTSPGQTIQVTLIRNGEPMEIPLTLGARP
jgi:2-alkenal reductase